MNFTKVLGAGKAGFVLTRSLREEEKKKKKHLKRCQLGLQEQ